MFRFVFSFGNRIFLVVIPSLCFRVNFNSPISVYRTNDALVEYNKPIALQELGRNLIFQYFYKHGKRARLRGRGGSNWGGYPVSTF